MHILMETAKVNGIDPRAWLADTPRAPAPAQERMPSRCKSDCSGAWSNYDYITSNVSGILLQCLDRIVSTAASAPSLLRKHTDHKRIRDPAVPVFQDHPGQLFPQSSQLRDPTIDRFQMFPCDPVDFFALLVRLTGQFDQLSDGVDFKPQFAGIAYEVQAFGVRPVVAALPTFRPRWRWQKPDALVIANRRNFHVRSTGKLTYRKIHDPVARS